MIKKGNKRFMITISQENLEKLEDLKDYFDTKQNAKAINEAISHCWFFYKKN